MSGFSFNGIHSSAFGVSWIPTADDLWFPDGDFENHETEVNWYNGGYFFGSFSKIRKLTLKCYFENITIAQREGIRKWLKRGTTGRLVLDDYPFVYFVVYPGEYVQGKWYRDRNCAGEERFSGTFNITFKAASPYGYLTRKYNNSDDDEDGAGEYCGLIPKDKMPEDPTTNSNFFYIYNPGTEDCGLTIELAGTCNNPIRFFNGANSTYCILTELPTQNLRLVIDGETGYARVRYGDTSMYDNGFAYHDRGYIKLKPDIGKCNISYKIANKIDSKSYALELIGLPVDVDMKDTKTYIGKATGVVTAINGSTNQIYIQLDAAATLADEGTIDIISPGNYIAIHEQNANGSWELPSTLKLTYLKVDYQPRCL